MWCSVLSRLLARSQRVTNSRTQACQLSLVIMFYPYCLSIPSIDQMEWNSSSLPHRWVKGNHFVELHRSQYNLEGIMTSSRTQAFRSRDNVSIPAAIPSHPLIKWNGFRAHCRIHESSCRAASISIAASITIQSRGHHDKRVQAVWLSFTIDALNSMH